MFNGRTSLASLAACLLSVSVGCEAPELSDAAKSSTTAPAPPVDPTTVDVAGIAGPPLPTIEIAVTDVPRKFNSHDPIKGRRSRTAGGMLGAVGGARFYAEYQTIINNIDQALALFNAEHSRDPKSHEEFWKMIIDANGAAAKLPQIEPQHEYIYVPEMARAGIMIRLTPGSEQSKLPKAEPGKEHIYDYAAVAAAGIQVPGLAANGSFDSDMAAKVAIATGKGEDAEEEEPPVNGAPAAAPAAAVTPTAPAGQPAADQPPAEEPSPNIRERAGQIGGQADTRTQEALEGGP